MSLKKDITDGVFNIGTGRESSLNELLAIILKVTRSSIKPEYHPVRKTNPVKRRRADINRAKEALGFEAKISLEEGIKSLVEWRKQMRSK